MKKKSSGFLKLLPFAGICAAGLVVAAFILLLATTGVSYNYTTILLGRTGSATFSGQMTLFGGEFVYDFGGGYTVSDPVAGSGVALTSWILVLAALAVLVVTFVLSLVKIKIVIRLAGLLNLAAAGVLIAAGIMLLTVPGNFVAANQDRFDWFSVFSNGDTVLGAGWIVAAILCFVGALVAAVPGCLELFAKIKGKK